MINTKVLFKSKYSQRNKHTCGTAPINMPTKKRNAKIHPNDGEADVRVPYQNKNTVAQTRVGLLPNLSAIIPQEGAPNIIPENQIINLCYGIFSKIFLFVLI